MKRLVDYYSIIDKDIHVKIIDCVKNLLIFNFFLKKIKNKDII